jgi:hypothetical protein
VSQYAAAKGVVTANQDVSSRAGKRVTGPGSDNVGAQRQKEAMSRKLVWIDQQRFRGFGCSECVWRFKPSGAPTGTSFDEMMRNFELRRDKEFTLHVCADHPRIKSTNSE